MARVRLLEKTELGPGETTLVHLSLNRPVALVKGDHFIIRSPEETLGGGEVVESQARQYRRFSAKAIQGFRAKARGTAEEVIMAVLETKQPLELSALLAQGDLPAAQLEPVVESLIEQKEVITIGKGGDRLLLTASGWERLANEVVGVLQEYHQRFPARLGMTRAELASRLQMGTQRPAILSKLVDGGIIVGEGSAVVRLPSHQIQLTPAQQASIDAFLGSLGEHPYDPPTELIPEPDLLSLLISRRQVVKVASDVVFSASAYDEMVEMVTAHLKASGRVTVAQVRDMFHTSRKYAVALLEHLDGIKVTRRVGDERVLC
jgi:selenocysteine-specific elongation factor